MNWTRDSINISEIGAIKLSVASRDDILNWSYGEVTKPETVNYRTRRPERDGLFCERIFGPIKDIDPRLIKLGRIRSSELAIDKEGNLVTKSISRRERMGHIDLAVPVAHPWFMRGVPSALSLLLNITVNNIQKVIYFASYLIIDTKPEKIKSQLEILESTKINESEDEYHTRRDLLDSFTKGGVITEFDYRHMPPEYRNLITVEMGASAIKKLLDEIDLDRLIQQLETESQTTDGISQREIQKRLSLMKDMRLAGIKPGDLILTVIPVIPPDLRPMIALPGNRFAISDLNNLYRRIIDINNKLKKLFYLNAPEVICRNEMRLLQEAVDMLIDNSSHDPQTPDEINGKRRLKSLSESLKGKQGLFRENLLGKRVDYSGRSVVVPDPELKLNECGLPRKMALELFKPFLISWLLMHGYARDIRSALYVIKYNTPLVWEVLEVIVKDKYILLNRMPSLHRSSIQAFRPRLTCDKVIRLNPLVASSFNTDYDGDQMIVHLPLSSAAQTEAKELMSASKNLLKTENGTIALTIKSDIVLGVYYLTYNKPSTESDTQLVFSSVYEAEMAYDQAIIDLQTPIRLFVKGEIRNTTLGRTIFNEILPKDYPYDNKAQTKEHLSRLLENIFDIYGPETTAKTADALKDLAFEYVTIASISISKDDFPTSSIIDDLITDGDDKANKIQKDYDEGLITKKEHYYRTLNNWHDTDSKISNFLKDKLSYTNSDIAIMVNSGALKNISNIKLASAEIGIVVDVNNHEIDFPIKSSYKKGLTTYESLVAAQSARQGQISTALRTADSGYLTRRLVNASQNVFTTDQEAEDPGFTIYRDDTKISGINFAARIAGRYSAEAIPGYINANSLITKQIAEQIEKDPNIDVVKIQSVLSTKAVDGVPQKAYGIDLSTHELVKPRVAVGIIAAESLGGLGTQLTLNVKHDSGIAGSGTISQGLRRVEELLEAHAPANQAFAATTGNHHLNLQDLFEQKGPAATKRYIINEILGIYAAEGYKISPKHVEIIVQQMFSRVQVTDPGDSNFVIGNIISKASLARENKRLKKQNKTPIKYTDVLLGITEVSIHSDSFLAAAASREAIRTFTNAATHGCIDHLRGLTENIIVGRRIPVGTGVMPFDDFTTF